MTNQQMPATIQQLQAQQTLSTHNNPSPSSQPQVKNLMSTDVGAEEKARETVIIFDWDDTLLCSSYLSGKGYRLDTESISKDVQMQLRELEASVITVLNLAMTYGTVHVITNAETGWVQLSAQKYIPGVVPLLSKVTVLSARSTYEGMFPDCPLKWKFYAFQEKLANVFAETNTEKNIISFGDSHVEREAVRAVTRGLPNTKTKSVKFAERPSMEQLRRQIELVTNCFQYIHNHEGDLDLQLTVTVNNENNNQSNQNNQQQQFNPTKGVPQTLAGKSMSTV